jgi:outer membrane murein-binding lipoprotein Lpp
MKRLCVLLCALLGALTLSGCASEGKPGQWDDFWKDVRGDNMQMKSDFSAFK